MDNLSILISLVVVVIMSARTTAIKMIQSISQDFKIDLFKLTPQLDRFFPETKKEKIVNRGAGNEIDHYYQDLSELYFCYKYQTVLDSLGYNLTSDRSGILYQDFMKYSKLRDMDLGNYNKSVYKTDIDSSIEQIVLENLQHYSGKAHDIYDIEKESRNQGDKADFVLQFKEFSEKYSLKNYKNFGGIQVCSGTHVSLLDYFVLNKRVGPGKFITNDGTTFSSRNQKLVFTEYCKHENGLELYLLRDELSKLNLFLKNKYVYGEFASFFTEEVKNEFDKDKLMIANETMKIIITGLNLLETDSVKYKILSRTGLCNDNSDTKLLCIFPGVFYNSTTNKRFQDLIRSLNLSNVGYTIDKQSLKFTLSVGEKVILDINIPFTINKNGAWFNDKNYTIEPFYYKSENMHLYHNQRRPKKSAQLAPSTNMYIPISQLFN